MQCTKLNYNNKSLYGTYLYKYVCVLYVYKKIHKCLHLFVHSYTYKCILTSTTYTTTRKCFDNKNIVETIYTAIVEVKRNKEEDKKLHTYIHTF